MCVFTCGLHDAQLQDCRVPLDRGVLGWVLRHNEAQLVNDMARDPRTVHAPETPCGEAQASIIVPLRFGAEVMGVLCLNRHGGRVFSESDFEPVQLFADVAAIAIRNVGVYSELERRAVSDGLTGISNYRHFCEALASEVSRARRYGERFCLLMMDLDHFKRVNDTIGHQKGDDVLRAVTGVLRRCSRESDFLARYGGEEFVMILPNTGLSEAKTLAERIRVAVAEMEVDRVDLRVTISIGVAAFPDSAADADGVLGAADAALLRAKARGRNRVCVHCDGQDDLAVEIGGDLVELGSRFARFIGLSKAETQGSSRRWPSMRRARCGMRSQPFSVPAAARRVPARCGGSRWRRWCTAMSGGTDWGTPRGGAEALSRASHGLSPSAGATAWPHRAA